MHCLCSKRDGYIIRKRCVVKARDKWKSVITQDLGPRFVYPS